MFGSKDRRSHRDCTRFDNFAVGRLTDLADFSQPFPFPSSGKVSRGEVTYRAFGPIRLYCGILACCSSYGDGCRGSNGRRDCRRKCSVAAIHGATDLLGKHIGFYGELLSTSHARFRGKSKVVRHTLPVGVTTCYSLT